MGDYAKQRSEKAGLKGKLDDYKLDIAWPQKQNMWMIGKNPPRQRENNLIRFYRWHFKTGKKGVSFNSGLECYK